MYLKKKHIFCILFLSDLLSKNVVMRKDLKQIFRDFIYSRFKLVLVIFNVLLMKWKMKEIDEIFISQRKMIQAKLKTANT